MNNQEGSAIWGLDPKNEAQLDFFTKIFQDRDFISDVKREIYGIKPNLKFYQTPEALQLLSKILENFEGSYRILDAKLSDGFNTEMGVIKNYAHLVDAITIAPASGDDVSFIHHLQGEKNIDVFSMGAMSFPGVVNDLLLGKYDFQFNKIQQNLENQVAGIVVGATAYNPDIESEVLKIKQKLEEGNIEFYCLRGHSDDELREGITLRNKLFKEVYQSLKTSPDTKVLTPGFGRQGGNWDNFSAGIGSDNTNHHLFNAGSGTITDLDGRDLETSKQEIIKRLGEFNLRIEEKFIGAAKFPNIKILKNS